MKATDRRSPC